mgnify:FL=1
MRNRERNHILNQIGRDLDDLKKHVDHMTALERATRRLYDYRGRGYPTGQSTGTGQTNTINNPVANIIANGQPDPYDQTIKQIDQHLTRARESINTIRRLVDATNNHRTPNDQNTTQPDSCATCTQHGHTAPTHATTPTHGPQCRWCYDYTRNHGQPPTKPLTDAHHAGQRITPTMIQKLGRTTNPARGVTIHLESETLPKGGST